jgi:hypothetical protein
MPAVEQADADSRGTLVNNDAILFLRSGKNSTSVDKAVAKTQRKGDVEHGGSSCL